MPFTKSIEVRYADCDMMQHVNNAVYLHYLEEARVGYYGQLMGHQGLGDIDFILGEVRIRYLSPAMMSDMLKVAVQVSDMRRSSFTMQYTITGGADDRVVATAETVQVMFDYGRQASKPIPDSLRERIAQHEGRPFPAPAVT
jgi:acyl-CoA thioester hydrolase